MTAVSRQKEERTACLSQHNRQCDKKTAETSANTGATTNANHMAMKEIPTELLSEVHWIQNTSVRQASGRNTVARDDERDTHSPVADLAFKIRGCL